MPKNRLPDIDLPNIKTQAPVTDVFDNLEEALPEGTVVTDEVAEPRMGRSAERHQDSRQSERRQSTADARGLSKAQMIKKFATEMYNNVLPSLPEIEGYHLCWLSTTHQADSISHRESIGYERVKPEDMPGFDHITLQQGPFAGCIGLNEMVLFKLPMDLWKTYMNIAHHERPYGEEEKIRDAVRYVRETAQEGGGDVYLGNGMSEIGRRTRRDPSFSE